MGDWCLYFMSFNAVLLWVEHGTGVHVLKERRKSFCNEKCLKILFGALL
jgi:hypothetical protein